MHLAARTFKSSRVVFVAPLSWYWLLKLPLIAGTMSHLLFPNFLMHILAWSPNPRKFQYKVYDQASHKISGTSPFMVLKSQKIPLFSWELISWRHFAGWCECKFVDFPSKIWWFLMLIFNLRSDIIVNNKSFEVTSYCFIKKSVKEQTNFGKSM